MSVQILWYNSHIKIGNVPILWEHAFNKGLLRVLQLYEEGKLISFQKANTYFDLTVMQFNALVSAIPKKFKSIATAREIVWKSSYAVDLDRYRLANHVYKKLNSDLECCKFVRIIEKWSKVLRKPVVKTDIYKMVQDVFRVTNIPKYRSFQYRIIIWALVTNKNLKQWGIKDSDTCTFCNLTTETVEHILRM